MLDGPRAVTTIVAAIEPFDDVERSHQAGVLAGLRLPPGGHVEPGEEPRSPPKAGKSWVSTRTSRSRAAARCP